MCILENVKAILVGRGHLKLLKRLRAEGYAGWFWKMLPTTFGLPQVRERIYFILLSDHIIPPAVSDEQVKTTLICLMQSVDNGSYYAVFVLRLVRRSVMLSLTQNLRIFRAAKDRLLSDNWP